MLGVGREIKGHQKFVVKSRPTVLTRAAQRLPIGTVIIALITRENNKYT